MNKIKSLLGLAKRAGKVIVGTDAVISKLQADKLYLIFVAKDSSAATIDKIEKKAFYYNVPIIKSFTSDELSFAIGSNNNKVLGIADLGFSKARFSKICVFSRSSFGGFVTNANRSI